MKKLLQTASVSLLALLAGVGCGSSDSSGDLVVEPTPNAGVVEAPVPAEQDAPQQYEGPIFIPGLTPPTDARDILARTGEEPGRNRGISDPFAVIPVDAIGQAPVDVGEVPVIPAQEGGDPPSATPTESQPVSSRAAAVRVTGVVHVGNTIRAIIESPNEPTSRHVRVGQFIAGTVLVKGIDINRSTPAVILEEDGVEFLKPIGEEPPIESSFITAVAPTAAVPPPPPNGIY